MGFQADAGIRLYKDRAVLGIECPENALIIGRRGVGLDSLELLLNKIAKRDEFRGSHLRVLVDAEDYRARRHVGIIQKTFVMANECLATQKLQGIPQLTARERHLARVALEQVEGVATRTLGGGALRNIQIFPSKGPEAPKDPPDAKRPKRP
jgi:spoIIIJ-associated protein